MSQAVVGVSSAPETVWASTRGRTVLVSGRGGTGHWVASSSDVTDEVWKKFVEDQPPEEPDDKFEVV